MKLRGLLPYVAVMCGAAALVLGGWGWFEEFSEYGALERGLETVYQTLKAFVLGDQYDHSQSWDHDWRLQAARVCGAIIAAFAIIKWALSAFDETLARTRAQLRSNHAVVIGEGEFALRFADLWSRNGRKTTWHSAKEVAMTAT